MIYAYLRHLSGHPLAGRLRHLRFCTVRRSGSRTHPTRPTARDYPVTGPWGAVQGKWLQMVVNGREWS